MIKILLYMFLTMWISAMIPFVHAAMLDNKLEYIDELVKRGMYED